MIYLTVRIDWQLALVALAVAPVLFLATWAYRPRLRSRSMLPLSRSTGRFRRTRGQSPRVLKTAPQAEP